MTSKPNLLFSFNFGSANSQPNSDDEEEEDIDYSPEEDEFKKVTDIKLFSNIFFIKRL